MGIVSISLSQSNNMKFLLVLAVAAYARAEAEADPGFVYTVGHHAPLVYNTAAYVHHAPLAYHAPLVYTAPVGCQNNEGAAVPCAHGALPYGLVPAVAPAPAEEEAVESVEKREAEPTAEADAEADPEADPWLYYHGLGYAARPLWICRSPLRLWLLRTWSGLCRIPWISPIRCLRRLQKWLRSSGALRREIVLRSQLLF